MQENLDTLARQHANGLGPAELLARWQQRADRKAPGASEPTPEQVDYARDYWQRVFQEQPDAQPDILCTRAAHLEMPYAEARRKVWALLLRRAEQISALRGEPFEWDFAGCWRTILPDLIRYFTNDPAGPLPPHKGLFLFGPPGTGKTELILVFAEFTRTEGLSKAFEFTSMSEVYTRARTDDAYDPIAPNVQFSRAFDEFGRYTGTVQRFGNGVDLNEAITEQRYVRFTRYGQVTHFIANAAPEDTQKMFTSMLFDRLRAMCTSVEFQGESKR